jgi:tetratricopeptide (TPR) repeat protein
MNRLCIGIVTVMLIPGSFMISPAFAESSFDDAIRQTIEQYNIAQDPQQKVELIDRISGYRYLLDVSNENMQLIRKFFESIPKSSQTASSLAASAYDLMQLNQPGKAAEVYLNVILGFPKDPRIQRYRIALARSFREAGDYRQAASQLEPIQKGNTPDAWWAKLERARVYLAAGDEQNAVKMYKTIETQSDNLKLTEIARAELEQLHLKKLARDNK